MHSELDAKNSSWRVLGVQEARIKHSAELLGLEAGSWREGAALFRDASWVPGRTNVDPPWTAALKGRHMTVSISKAGTRSPQKHVSNGQGGDQPPTTGHPWPPTLTLNPGPERLNPQWNS